MIANGDGDNLRIPLELRYGVDERNVLHFEHSGSFAKIIRYIFITRKCPSEDFLSPLNHLDSMEPILIRGGTFIVDGQEPGEVRSLPRDAAAVNGEPTCGPS
jgi:hypothetical protein